MSANSLSPFKFVTRGSGARLSLASSSGPGSPSTKCPNVIGNPGSVCPYPIPPTPGQPCTLPGELDCHYEIEYEHDCCGNRNAQNFTVSCVSDNSTIGAGLWQSRQICDSEGKGSSINCVITFGGLGIPPPPQSSCLESLRGESGLMTLGNLSSPQCGTGNQWGVGFTPG